MNGQYSFLTKERKGMAMFYKKVEISSVDTSKLAVLKGDECIEILKKAKDGDKKARERLINGNLRLVLSVVQRFRNRDEDPDDLFQVGCIGLIKACDNFDLTMNVRFSTYAVPMIIGEIKRHLRDNTYLRVSRSMRDTAYHAMLFKDNFIKENNREPTIEEIAAGLSLSTREIVLSLESVVPPVSIYEPVYSDNGDELYVLDQLSDFHTDDDRVAEISIMDAIEKLDDREKMILNMRFMSGKTQTEVADELSISQAQVSRIEKNIKRKIKE